MPQHLPRPMSQRLSYSTPGGHFRPPFPKATAASKGLWQPSRNRFSRPRKSSDFRVDCDRLPRTDPMVAFGVRVHSQPNSRKADSRPKTASDVTPFKTSGIVTTPALSRPCTSVGRRLNSESSTDAPALPFQHARLSRLCAFAVRLHGQGVHPGGASQ
jgi:hypothetical protein